jgi:aspartyl-tRNA(Asn)/glutamyl-tRNA(Gln) amidotransferase subunit B
MRGPFDRAGAGAGRDAGKLIKRIADGTVSNNAARQVFDALWSGEGKDVDAVIEAKGLKQMNDSGALEDRRRGDRRQCRQRRTDPRRQGQGLQRAGGPGDEGVQGQGQPGSRWGSLRKKLGL